jgi:hypothetical protein
MLLSIRRNADVDGILALREDVKCYPLHVSCKDCRY